MQHVDARSPSPQEDGFRSTERLIPPEQRQPRARTLGQRIHRLLGYPNTTGKEELIVVGLLAGMLLAGVLVGAAFMPKGAENDRMAALKLKFTDPSIHTVTTAATTTAASTTKKNATKPKVKARHFKRRNEEQPTTGVIEAGHDTDEAEETTTPEVEEQDEGDSEKKTKGCCLLRALRRPIKKPSTKTTTARQRVGEVGLDFRPSDRQLAVAAALPGATGRKDGGDQAVLGKRQSRAALVTPC
ncbi:hypothetical protein HPB50_011140 [Hyalomma asiaticum]|uniref:Uncharacterized protein n=1 Tax=Hyalomma asiaticum TaxID=266040 RepID=A0ACB7STT3_HYAAI|nr:hypothetical protein HPB50_011140 [Hyalomma asiaticum]